MKQVGIFDYNRRTAADEKVADLLLKRKSLFFLQIVKEPMPEPDDQRVSASWRWGATRRPGRHRCLNGQDSGGRALTVNEARPKPEGHRGGSGDQGGYRW